MADTHTPFSLGNSSSCDHACPVLATNEWLANAKYWTMEPPANLSVVAVNPTVSEGPINGHSTYLLSALMIRET